MGNNKNKVSRRQFIHQIAVGSLTAPTLIQMLSETVLGQTQPHKQQIIWLQGQTSGIHRMGILSLPGFNEFINKYFSVIPVDQMDVDDLQTDLSNEVRSHILILDGYFTQDYDDHLHNMLKDLIVISRAAILLGNEASYSNHAPEGFMDLEQDLLHHVETPYFKLPGAPVHPAHILGSLNHMILYDLPDLDEYKRPTMFFGNSICDRCEYRGDLERGRFVKHHGGGSGCLYLLGCKGPKTRNTCPTERWNNATSWCVAAGSPCVGCSEPDYPNHLGLGMFGQLPSGEAGSRSAIVRHSGKIIGGALGLTVAGIGIHALSSRNASQNQSKAFIQIQDESK
jgi:Ni,Fe-hydrogenase I small subunit